MVTYGSNRRPFTDGDRPGQRGAPVGPRHHHLLDDGRTDSTPVGSYASTCSGVTDANYTITYVSGTVPVTAATLTVTANNQTMPFGSAVPTLTATITGFVDGQTLATSGVTGWPVCTTTATSMTPAGTYPITCTIGTLTATNYTFAFVSGTLTITSTTTIACYTIGQVTVSAGQSVKIAPGCFVIGDHRQSRRLARRGGGDHHRTAGLQWNPAHLQLGRGTDLAGHRCDHPGRGR